MSQIIAGIVTAIFGLLFKRFDEPTYDFKEAGNEKIPGANIFDAYDWVPKD
jgi:hypothetical protein